MKILLQKYNSGQNPSNSGSQLWHKTPLVQGSGRNARFSRTDRSKLEFPPWDDSRICCTVSLAMLYRKMPSYTLPCPPVTIMVVSNN